MRFFSYASACAIAVLLFIAHTGKAQAVFEVPAKVNFAGMQLRLDPSAREVVKKHGQQLIKNNKFYRSMTERADGYFPLIERVFKEEGLPDDFKYLSIQESGLTSDVVSSSKAVGYWQFKAETATDFGLRVDPDVDERMNILSSSRAAARYLKKNNLYLNNWVHALISYYTGLGGAKLVVDNSLSGLSEMDITANTHFYVLKFRAHKIAFENAVNRSPNPGLQVMEFPECEGKTLRQIASETNVDLAQLEFYNKWCRAGAIPTDRDYSVMIPVKSDERPSWLAMQTRPTPQLGDNLKPWKEKVFFGLIEKEEAPDEKQNPQATMFFSWNGIKAILAGKADNINRLAIAAGVTREEIMDYNDLRIFDLIVPGQVYYVKPKRRKARIPFHSARFGESLWEVAQSYGITLQSLLRKNRMNSVEKIKTGRILWLRHIRPEDHPVEYDPNMQSAPTLPLSEPLIVSAGKHVPTPTPTPALVTTSSTVDGPLPTIESVEAKYAAVQPQAAEQIAPPPPPTIVDARIDAMPHATTPVAKPNEVNIPSPSSAPAGFQYHKVEAGQSLYSLSKQYDSNIDSLRTWNQMPDNALELGQMLLVKTTQTKRIATQTSAPAPQVNGYTVKIGDTLYSIARYHGLTIEALKSFNQIEGGLKTGQILRVQ